MTTLRLGTISTPMATHSGEASTAPRAAANRRGGRGGGTCSRTTPDLCRKRAGSDLGQLALRRLLSAPGRASGCPSFGQPWPLSRLGQHWPAMLALFRHGVRLEFVRPDVLQPAEVAVEIPGTIVGAAIRRDEAAAGASGTPGEARLRRSLRRHRCLRREHPAAFRAAGAVALAWKGHAAEA